VKKEEFKENKKKGQKEKNHSKRKKRGPRSKKKKGKNRRVGFLRSKGGLEHRNGWSVQERKKTRVGGKGGGRKKKRYVGSSRKRGWEYVKVAKTEAKCRWAKKTPKEKGTHASKMGGR